MHNCYDTVARRQFAREHAEWLAEDISVRFRARRTERVESALLERQIR